MSTTKIFIIFGIFVFILTVPLLVIYIWFPIVLGRYVSLVENVIVGTIGAYVVALALDFTLRRRQEKAVEKVARVGLTEVSQTINGMLAFFSSMIKASSDGFTPSMIEDLFSIKAAELISLHLALSSPAPVTSNITWQDHITGETRFLLDKLTSIQDRYQAFIPEDVLANIGTLRNNALFVIFKDLSSAFKRDKQLNIERPVLNITPLEVLTSLMNEILDCIKIIQQVALKLEASIVPKFPSYTLRDDVSPKVGAARFDGKPGVGIFIGEMPPGA